MTRQTPSSSPRSAIGLRLGALAMALVMAGCTTLQTPYTQPAVQTPAQWEQARTANGDAASIDRWWQQFNDPALTLLVDTALARNNDLAAATSRVRQAQLQAGLTGTALSPTVSASASSSASRSLDSSNAPSSRGSGLSASVSYEVDLWGKLASSRNAAEWEARASAQDRESTAQALVASTAGLYWQLAYLNERYAGGEQSLAYARQTLELVQAQYRAGAVSSLEVREAQQTVTTQQSTLSQLQQQRVETRNALAILLDAPPIQLTLQGTLKAEPQQLDTQPLPEVAAGLPADLLGRRPDLRAAELRLRTTLASGDATRASYYPSLTLTGSLGTSSSSLLNLLSNPVATLGAGLALPFLRQTEMKLSNQLSQAQYEEAVVTFRQTLYQAFADVENALSSRKQLAEQGALLTQRLEAAREVERLYEVRYRAGAAPLRTWLDAQESRRAAELALSENRLSQYNALATLYKALGGGAL
ncbi:efflux transporter outer membrane subunit [Variovorax sp. VNK109]|uniref:efflux transporter outer membrane subunit n=1 Tax=Variovorax sp. VNK109 TaxID=3400919 RepID=UPI003C030DBB